MGMDSIVNSGVQNPDDNCKDVQFQSAKSAWQKLSRLTRTVTKTSAA